MGSSVLFCYRGWYKLQNAAVWQKKKDDVQVGGDGGDSSQSGKSVHNFFFENHSITVSEIQSCSKPELYCKVMLMDAN